MKKKGYNRILKDALDQANAKSEQKLKEQLKLEELEDTVTTSRLTIRS